MSDSSWSIRWRQRLLRILSILAVVALTIFLFSLRERAAELAAYGYPGLLALSVVTNATLVLPMPSVAITFAAGAVFNPWLVGLIAGIGATLGELTGYLAGFGGQEIVERTPLYDRLEGWTERYGNWAILGLAFVPNPVFDLAGAAAGALGMPVRQFLIWAGLGKTGKMLIFALAGAHSARWVLDLWSGW